MDEETFVLLFGEVRQLVPDNMAVQKGLFGDIAQSAEVKSCIRVLGTGVHLIELIPQSISDLAVHVGFSHTKLKR